VAIVLSGQWGVVGSGSQEAVVESLKRQAAV